MNVQHIADQLIASAKKSFLWDMRCTVYIHSNVICVMKIMSVLLPDTYTNALVNTVILLSANTLKRNMTIKNQRSITSLKS